MCKIHIETDIPSVHAVILMGIVCDGYRRHSFPTELMFYDLSWLKVDLLYLVRRANGGMSRRLNVFRYRQLDP